MSMWKAFGRGFDSRRLHLKFITATLLLITTWVFAQSGNVIVFEGPRKTEIQVFPVNGQPYVRIPDLQKAFNFHASPIAGNQSTSLSIGSHNVILSLNRALVSLDDRLVSLSHPAIVQGEGVWYVPLDFIPKVLKTASGKKFLWLENSRSIIIGDILQNSIQLKDSATSSSFRVVLQSERPIRYSINREPSAILITPEGEDYTVGFQTTTFDNSLIKGVSVHTVGARKAFRIHTTELVDSFKTLELSDPPRLVIDFVARETSEQPQSQEVRPTLLPSVVPNRKVIVIDPGHGGTETGAKGSGGTLEKDIVLAIAKKLKSTIESATGMKVILTRDADRAISLDDRTALANNNKAELFISIHANATLKGSAKGAETYYLSTKATDDEGRNIAAVENNVLGLEEQQQIEQDLKLILWDMAQTEYLTVSSRLAETIQQELNATLGIANRGVKQAPFRVLMGATMPAVLIEVGFINNPSEEKLMLDSEYQAKIAKAIFKSIQMFQGITPKPETPPAATDGGR